MLFRQATAACLRRFLKMVTRKYYSFQTHWKILQIVHGITVIGRVPLTYTANCSCYNNYRYQVGRVLFQRTRNNITCT